MGSEMCIRDSQPELAPKLQGTFFLGAGLVDAIPIIGVGIAMYLIFVVAG